jgi:hypothetical protein
MWVTRTDATSCLAINRQVSSREIPNPPTQTESRSKPPMFAGDTSLCQTVSLSSWLHSGHRKMWTSESPPGLDTIAIKVAGKNR